MSSFGSKLLNVPEYIDIYRFFTVEELALESPLDYHHGKCSVIGRVVFVEGHYYLTNIRLQHIQPKYQVPSGQLRILLLFTDGPSNINRTVEVSGETVFWKRADDTKEYPTKITPKTTAGLVHRIRSTFVHSHTDSDYDTTSQDHLSQGECEFDEDKIGEYLDEFDISHVHAIRVHWVREVDEPDELIYYNLKIRQLMRRLDAAEEEAEAEA